MDVGVTSYLRKFRELQNRRETNGTPPIFLTAYKCFKLTAGIVGYFSNQNRCDEGPIPAASYAFKDISVAIFDLNHLRKKKGRSISSFEAVLENLAQCWMSAWTLV